MNLYEDWSEIRRIFSRSLYASIATVGPDGAPHVTPIGSLMLHREPGRAFWFERFTVALPQHLDVDPRLCAMAVDTRLHFWGKALLRGGFPTAPGIRLSGTAGVRREAEAAEVERFQRRVRRVKWTKGHELLWSDHFTRGRDVTFDRVLPLRLGRMWPGHDLASKPA